MVEDNYLEQIEEVKYLAQENTPRYRLIMKFLFSKYEEAEYWLYKEEIYDEVKKTITEYTEEECDRDLEFLLSNGSLTKLQDTQNINTINDFKFHNFRYQMTDKAVIIERMTIELEEIEVKVASLEPRLFGRINDSIKRLTNIYNLDENQIYDLWIDINNDFIEIDENKTKYLMNSLISHQKKAPKISPEFDYEKLRRVNVGKWQSLKKWFVSSTTQTEGERLLEATQNVIQKIYKYANSLMELHGNMINRKEEYKHICHLFDNLESVEEANKLSSAVFGIITTNHYKMSSLVNTDSLINSYDIPSLEIPINTTFKEYKIKSQNSQIIDKSMEKERILEEIRQKEKIRKSKISNLIKSGKIVLENEIHLDEIERRYVLDLIEKATKTTNKESEFGYPYYITNQTTEKCKIVSEDGIFELTGRTIIIEVGETDE